MSVYPPDLLTLHPHAPVRIAMGGWRIAPAVESVRARLDAWGVRSWLVGGAVRDALLGREAVDIDIAVEGRAHSAGVRLASDLDGAFVPWAGCDEEMVRVVLRVKGDNCVVDFSSATNGIVSDLSRRDFTVNAMAVPLTGDPPTGPDSCSLVDPFGGLADLRARTIRAVSPGVFSDDPARLIRAPRLAAQLGFAIDGETRTLIRESSRLLREVSAERVSQELFKLLGEPGATRNVRDLDDLGVLCEVLPELAYAKDVTQPREHYFDVFNHLVESVGQAERIVLGQPGDGDWVVDALPRFDGIGERFAEPVGNGFGRLSHLKLAALLHDVAKPCTRTVEQSGRIRFLGHHIEGERITAAIAERLRLSGRSSRLLSAMVRHHLRPGQLGNDGSLPTRRAMFRFFRDAGDAAVDTIYLNLADFLAARGPLLEREEWAHACEVAGEMLAWRLERDSEEPFPKLVSGHDIMDGFALPPGPVVGKMLAIVAEAAASGEIETKEDAMALVGARLRSGGDLA